MNELAFVDCPNKACKRPYKKTWKYPEEFCPYCESQGIFWRSIEEIEKELKNDRVGKCLLPYCEIKGVADFGGYCAKHENQVGEQMVGDL